MLEIRSLSVSYNGIVAVRDASLTARPGITCLVGRNGAGKSSLVNAIAGIVKATSGAIILDGKDLIPESAATRSRHGIALVPETRRIYGSLSALENLKLGARGKRAQIDARLAEVLELFPAISRFKDRGGHQLSGGEQQMVAIARAYMCAPKVLILDEPSLGLGPIVVKAVFGSIVEMARRGQTILLIEQNGRAALRISDYAYTMAYGEIRSLDHRAPDFKESDLQSLYL